MLSFCAIQFLMAFNIRLHTVEEVTEIRISNFRSFFYLYLNEINARERHSNSWQLSESNASRVIPKFPPRSRWDDSIFVLLHVPSFYGYRAFAWACAVCSCALILNEMQPKILISNARYVDIDMIFLFKLKLTMMQFSLLSLVQMSRRWINLPNIQ